MIFAREKRQLLGWLALLAPLPLPLNDVLEWPVLFAYLFLVIFYLQRVESGFERWLPNWALNLLGLAYLPILLVDLNLGLRRGQVVKALLHLILFLVLVKLFSIRREKDKWHIFAAIFFLFVAAMATSSHLTIAFYLLVSLVAGFYVMARFAHLHVLASLGQEPPKPPPFPPVRWSIVMATLLIVAVSVPIFASLPRLRQPFVMGRGTDNIGLARTTGFSDTVNLSLTSEIRSNRSVALRIQFSEPMSGDGLRFKGAAYDFYRERRWFRHPVELRSLVSDREGRFQLPGGETARTEMTATVYREPLDSDSLVLPMEAVGFDLPEGSGRRLRIDPGGAVSLPSGRGRQKLSYEVRMGMVPVIAAYEPNAEKPLPSESNLPFTALDDHGISENMRALAREVMGDGSDGAGAGERVDRLLAHLLGSYTYTTNFVGRDGEQPIEDFLFRYRSGHCEYFATAMVLLLRAEGIPARLVTGFLGAEFNPIEDYFIVRQQNAHAWVEAFTEDRGWRVYDPTPPDGRPFIAASDWRLLLQQMYDYVAFRWDRYVLSYGSADQESFFRKTRDRIAALWARLWASRPESAPALPGGTDQPGSEDLALPERAAVPVWQTDFGRLGIVVLLALAAATWVLWRRRHLTPEAAYAELRSVAAALELPVGPTMPPLELRTLLARAHPEASEDPRADTRRVHSCRHRPRCVVVAGLRMHVLL
ncbi:MAG: DUF3488 and transglutaminase-like domain-containing protein, partial [Holophagales bacterium]|nr:DUF3488 and transglutaminase-like domain-containing protein [Holophagales bacterium]